MPSKEMAEGQVNTDRCEQDRQVVAKVGVLFIAIVLMLSMIWWAVRLQWAVFVMSRKRFVVVL